MARISDWCTKFGYQIIPAAQTLDAAIFPTGNKFVVVDMFTTLNGVWDLSNQGQIGCIPPWARDQYNDPGFDDKGAATHLFFQVLDTAGRPNRATQCALWSDGYAKLASFDGRSQPDWLTIQAVKPTSGWGNISIEHNSGFDYQSGVTGPWCLAKMPGLSDVVTGLGLPLSWHISTFVVFQEVPRSAVPPIEPPVEGTLRSLIADCQDDFDNFAALVAAHQARLARLAALVG